MPIAITLPSPIRLWGEEQAWGIHEWDHWFFACQLADLEREGPRQSEAFYTGDLQLTDRNAAWAVGQLHLTEANPKALAELRYSVAYFEAFQENPPCQK